MRDRGFPVDIIAQVIGLGAFAGNEAATGLLSMSDLDFTEFLTSLTGIRSMGAAIGNLAAGMQFDPAITAAQDQLGAARTEASRAGLSVGVSENMIARLGADIGWLAQTMQEDFAFGVKDFISTLGPLPDDLARVFEIFAAKLNGLTEGTSRGIFDVLQNSATGGVPGLLKAFVTQATPSFSGINGSGGGGGGAGGGANQPGSKSNPIAVAPVKVSSLSPWGAADAGSLGIPLVNDLARRASTNTAYGMADAGSLGLPLHRNVGASQMENIAGITINVAGSIVQEKQIVELVRQGSLEDQRSGKAWALDVLT